MRLRTFSVGKRLFFVVVISAALMSFSCFCEAQVSHRKQVPVEKRVSNVEADISMLKKEVEGFTLEGMPRDITLCDKKIPLMRVDIRERFEREFFLMLEKRGLMTIVIKRYLKWFNMISEDIQREALPQDLIFLVIAESYMNPRALSGANAAGLWQFIKGTGKQEGLQINDYIDERYNIRKATRAALIHLKRLYGEFGDWPISMAAYNAGAGRLRGAIKNQDSKEFIDLFLPEETERYVFRIASLKEIILNREKYGFVIDDKDLYKPVAVTEIIIATDREVHTSLFAKSMEVSYKIFRDHNLHIRRYRLPKGTYHIITPTDKREIFLKNLKNCPYIDVVKDR